MTTTNNKTATKLTKEQIVALAKEVNTVLSLDKDAIRTTKNDAQEVITAQILNHSVKFTSDDFANGDGDPIFTISAVETLKVLGVKVPKAKADKGTAQSDKPGTTSKGKGKGTKKTEPAKEKAYTWTDATADAIRKVCKKGATLAEIKAAAIVVYKEHGHSGEKEPKNVFRYMALSLVTFKVLVLKDGKYSFPVVEKA